MPEKQFITIVANFAKNKFTEILLNEFRFYIIIMGN